MSDAIIVLIQAAASGVWPAALVLVIGILGLTFAVLFWLKLLFGYFN